MAPEKLCKVAMAPGKLIDVVTLPATAYSRTRNRLILNINWDGSTL